MDVNKRSFLDTSGSCSQIRPDGGLEASKNVSESRRVKQVSEDRFLYTSDMTPPARREPPSTDALLASEPAVPSGILIGYARVSTGAQKLERQIDALIAAGCRRIFTEKKSGKNADRPELSAALDFTQPGDTLVVPSLDRLGRSLQDLIAIVSGLRAREIGFTSLHEALDTTTPGGRLVFHVFAALAEFIRELIIVGTNEGLAAAKARGQRLGRPPAMTAEQLRQARDLLTRPDNTVASIARLLGVSRGTIYNRFPELRGADRKAIARADHPTAIPAVQGSPARAAVTAPVFPAAANKVIDGDIVTESMGTSMECPTCGDVPTEKQSVRNRVDDLGIVWLYTHPVRSDQLIEAQHCGECQPHESIASLSCTECGEEGPMLAGDLAAQFHSGDIPPQLAAWLSRQQWRTSPVLRCSGCDPVESPRR